MPPLPRRGPTRNRSAITLPGGSEGGSTEASTGLVGAPEAAGASSRAAPQAWHAGLNSAFDAPHSGQLMVSAIERVGYPAPTRLTRSRPSASLPGRELAAPNRHGRAPSERNARRRRRRTRSTRL